METQEQTKQTVNTVQTPASPALQDKPKPKVKLTGTDGNIFALIGRASACLRRAGLKDQVAEMTQKAFHAGGYYEALSVICEYVDAR